MNQYTVSISMSGLRRHTINGFTDIANIVEVVDTADIPFSSCDQFVQAFMIAANRRMVADLFPTPFAVPTAPGEVHIRMRNGGFSAAITVKVG